MKWFSDHFLKISGACTEYQSVFVKAVAGINAFSRLHIWFNIKSEFGGDDIGVDGRWTGMGRHLIHFIQFGDRKCYFISTSAERMGCVFFLIAFSQNMIEIEMIKQSKCIFTHNQQPNVGDNIYCCTDSGTSGADMLEWLPGRSFFSLAEAIFHSCRCFQGQTFKPPASESAPFLPQRQNLIELYSFLRDLRVDCTAV